MWIFTSTGFVSAVQKPGSTELTVRARDHRSLEPLAADTGVDITHTPMADYPYRLVVTREGFSAWIVSCVDDLDYPNFKSQVARSRGHAFAHALSDVWSDMHAVTDLP
jgi:hypothetical protein